ncbi:hypothetical protein FACS1894189_5530 [Planctomycetales bacterium]|nr:hypothetical protein FACS1894189_5530 [Planctomycetales bacterium]
MFDFYEQLAVNDSKKSGNRERQITDARRMRAKGYAVADISEITELPVEEIELL